MDPQVAVRMCADRSSKLVELVILASVASGCTTAESAPQSSIRIETLVQSNSAWDATPYTRYPDGQPLMTVLRIVIAPHTKLEWHSHPMPNAAYVLSGELTLEVRGGVRKHFVAGQAITETVNRIHRGFTGEAPTVLIVFYAGVPGLPLSQPASDLGLSR
jgi:quercetin dioxygenase-like cupin family protein